MCAIAGLFVSSGAQTPVPSLLESLKAMNATMAHRGPDGDGFWVADDQRIGFAHRRLAIVDLSADAAQPMANGDGSLQLTFNGEIYNHALLRKELEALGHRFKTDHSDSEVLIHGFRQWGIDELVRRLDGMFAFAIWDVAAGKLTLARDRIGIKPVYFSRHQGIFRFASEIKAILSDPGVPRRTNPTALNHYLSFMVAPAPLTLFEGIYKLPAAHFMEVDASGRISARRYWDALPDPAAPPCTETEAIAGIRQRLDAAVDKRLMSDVPFGVFLSGGIDSSANVALMSQKMDRPVDTFTVGFKDHTHLNELDYANQVSEKFNTNHHEILVDESDMLNYLDDLVHQQDEPIADWVCVPLYFVSKLAKDSGVTVVQVGEGADEQFCGYDSWMKYLKTYATFWDPYTTYVPRFLRAAIGRLAGLFAPARRAAGAQLAEALVRAGSGHDLFWSGANAFWNVHKARVLGRGWQNTSDFEADLAGCGFDLTGLASTNSGDIIKGYMADLAKSPGPADHLGRMSYNEFRLRLPELLLMRVDKISMSTSIEGRVPFLDHQLVEFTQNLPQSLKVKGGVKKHLLKEAVKDLLPADIIHRKKMGFAAPVEQWLKGEFGKRAEDTILNSQLVKDAILERAYITARFAEHRAGTADHALHIWTLFNLCAWHKHWIEGA
ncbi:MAG: asparagine synthase (glutamine-hydrolyzing) [Rhodospirillales bacterium]|nr:asparagine synthase (glutamine-hydrolyzing) [Rhodospirillales bacterium]